MNTNRRAIKIEDLRKRRTKPLEQVFWEHVAGRGSSGCWEWLGQLNTDGYGRLNIGEHKMVMAHRYAYQLSSGVSIPEGKKVLHDCDNPRCVNPAHLFLGTLLDNTHDMKRKGRASNPPVHIGETNSHAKLTERQVRTIRERYSQKTASQDDLAQQYGVSAGNIYRIVNNLAWKHVTTAPVAQVAMTSGCFDVLHLGHVWLFHEMRKLVGPQGHVVVLLNDDSYLLRAKGRIIVPLEQRMGLLLALRDVDMVIPFEDNDPCSMIRLAEPTYFCKGPEYANIEIPETKIIESYGGELRFVEGGPDVHTSDIIREIKKVRKI